MRGAFCCGERRGERGGLRIETVAARKEFQRLPMNQRHNPQRLERSFERSSARAGARERARAPRERGLQAGGAIAPIHPSAKAAIACVEPEGIAPVARQEGRDVEQFLARDAARGGDRAQIGVAHEVEMPLAKGVGHFRNDSDQRALSDAGGPKKGESIDNYLLKVDNPLVVPVDKKVRIITTANDVIHAFMVPAFGIKQDAIPGFVRDTWFRAEKTGDFYGQCAELCGKEHAYMPIHVKVLSAEDYSAWVAGEKKKLAAKADDPSKVWALDDISKRGEKVYAQNCAACHQANGKGAGPIKALDGAAVVLDADKSKQIAILLNGQNNGSMPAWKTLSDTDIAAVITYTKNNWSNKTGQVVQPAEVLALRK